ncbi:NAD-dependent epimerase/dehydratase family protein [Marinibaculum pumilum]|uniref:NAD-dependent epimerase/dehydratase family protein n=1 Tax=Marinibaculum pumilum TaxID=1766165 RepID=A0ABV7KXP4_9PROT
MLTHRLDKPRDPARVVVVGSGGFIGRTLSELLAGEGVPVLPVDLPGHDLTRDGAGAALAAELRPDDALVFLASLTPDKGRDAGTFRTNLAIAEGVLAALAAAPVAHLLYFSTDGVYPFREALVSEATPAAPVDSYGAMHLAREILARDLAGRLEIPMAVLRATLIYGGRDTHNSYGPNRLRRMAAADGRITLFGEGEEMRDHVYVGDVARLILAVLRRRSAGLLNIATGRSVSYRQLAGMVAARFEAPVEIVGGPRMQAVTHRHFDVTALRRAFPDFRLLPLERGLALAHDEMRRHEGGA